jgi:purine-binding chemotaxis protein CheW
MTEALECKYLTLSLREELYAIPIGSVLEVLEYSQATKLPQYPVYLKGIINLRGRGVPVVDLRARFGLPELAATEATSIIVVEAAGTQEEMTVGLIADAVHEVVEIAPGDIASPPSFGSGASSGIVKGIARNERGFILILDLELMFDESDGARLLAPAAEEA